MCSPKIGASHEYEGYDQLYYVVSLSVTRLTKPKGQLNNQTKEEASDYFTKCFIEFHQLFSLNKCLTQFDSKIYL